MLDNLPGRSAPELLLGPLVGGVHDQGANLWGRARGQGVLHAWLGQQPDLSDAQLAARSLPLTLETGFSGVAPVRGLNPATRYHYALTLSDQPPEPLMRTYPAFTTFPRPGEAASFSFALGSCFRPDDENGGAIFRAVEERRQSDDLRFALLVGDQVYADAHAHNGLGKIAMNLEEYRALYEYAWTRPLLRKLLTNLPAFMMMDDHEVDNDWSWTDASRTQAQMPFYNLVIRWLERRPRAEWQIPRQRVQDALQAYWEHQAMHGPPLLSPPSLTPDGRYVLEPSDPGSLAYSFVYGAAAFFVLDTRTRRVKGGGDRTILGEGQWQALERWLLEVREAYPVKFLVTSSSVLFSMWVDITRDRWNGFPEERLRLLSFLAANGIEGVHILTGDLHSGHAIRAELYGPQGQGLPLWEFCSTPFEQEPNNLAQRFPRRLRGAPLKNLENLFVQAQRNFGVVRVDFSGEGAPRVRYRLYGVDGQLLGAAGS